MVYFQFLESYQVDYAIFTFFLFQGVKIGQLASDTTCSCLSPAK